MTTKKPPAPAVAWLVAGLSLTVLCAALYYLLREEDDVRSGLVLWMLPIVTGCFAAAKLEQNQAETKATLSDQTQQLTTITKQTNGVLDGKIKDGVRQVLDERDAERHRISTATASEPLHNLVGDEL